MYQKKLSNVSTAQCLNFSENVVSPKKNLVLGIPHFQTHPYIIYNHIYIYTVIIYIYCNHIYILYSYMVFIGLISIWLLVEPYPSENDGVSSSVGMMTFPIWWESHSKFHGSSHHQPAFIAGAFPIWRRHDFFLFGSDHSVAYPICRWRKKTIVSTVPSGKHWQFAKISIFAKSTNVPNFLWAIDGHCQ